MRMWWPVAPLLALVMIASGVHAQARPRRDTPQAGLERELPAGQQLNRQQLQRQLQRRVWQLTQRRVGLTDAQMNQLAPVHQRFETRRRAILREERQTRIALRDAMRDSTHTDQERVSGYLDRLVQLQRQRVDLLEQEQKELSQFMTPLQRARYTAVQEQIRRRVEQLARRNGLGPDTSADRPPRP